MNIPKFTLAVHANNDSSMETTSPPSSSPRAECPSTFPMEPGTSLAGCGNWPRHQNRGALWAIFMARNWGVTLDTR